jgi:hypothetical protein
VKLQKLGIKLMPHCSSSPTIPQGVFALAGIKNIYCNIILLQYVLELNNLQNKKLLKLFF